MEWLDVAALSVIVAVLVPVIGGLMKWSKWVGEHNNQHIVIGENMAEIKADLKHLLWRKADVILRGSPLRLSELGVQVSEYIGAKDIAASVSEKVANSLNSDNPYDVQERCLEFFKSREFDISEVEDIFKKCSFEHGIKLEQVMMVCAIELRDILLRNNEQDAKQTATTG